MNQTYFLGANSRDGFSSLYRSFPGEEGCFLHCIKGGPGTGKSSYMRKIGAAAEKRGLDVHYVLCSGDPQSLDGVYLPQLHEAWVDATAPHVIEPQFFGVDGDYINLGLFCRTPFSADDRARLDALWRRYRETYAAVYRKLTEAELRETRALPSEAPETLLDGLDGTGAQAVYPKRRFLRALSGEGQLVLEGEAEKLCKQIRPISSASLHALSSELERRGLPAVRCPMPLEPSRLEAVLLPWADLGFRADYSLFRLEPVAASLREAKAIHDEIEGTVGPYMDFEGLTDYTEAAVQRLFSQEGPKPHGDE